MSVVTIVDPRIDLPVDPMPGPPRPRPWGFWATLLWVALAVTISASAGIAIAKLFKFSLVENSAGAEIVSYLMPVAAILVLVVAARLARWPVHEYFAFSMPESRHLALGAACLAAWIGFGFALLYLFGVGATDWKTLTELYRANRASGTLFSLWLVVVVAAPVAEELIFRGFVYRGWAQSRIGPVATIAATALLFGLMHRQYTWVGIADCIFFGLLAGWLRWRSGSIAVPILLHALNNLVAIGFVASQAA